MAYKRTMRRPRGPAKKRSRKAAPQRSVAKANRGREVYYFKRHAANETDMVGLPASAPLLRTYQFSLNSVTASTDFTNLFDMYKITFVQVKFFLVIDPSAQAAAVARYPRMWWTRDYDDANTLSINQIRERSKCGTALLTPAKPITINVRPAIATEVFRTALSSGYAPKWRQWIDCDQPDVSHYGLKIAIDDLTNTNYRVQHEIKYWFAMKNVV